MAESSQPASSSTDMEDVLIDECIAKPVWDQIHTEKFENATLEEVEAFLDESFLPEGWLDPPKKKLKLSLKSKSRFASPTDKEKFSEAAKGVVPENTKKNNSWAEKTFLAWVEERNKAVPEDPVPIDLLSCHKPTVVCKYLRYFVLEVRSSTGEKYPPATIRSILSGLNRVMKDRKAPFSILDKSNPSFRELMLTLDSVTSELHRDGVGVSKKSAAVIYLATRALRHSVHMREHQQHSRRRWVKALTLGRHLSRRKTPLLWALLLSHHLALSMLMAGKL